MVLSVCLNPWASREPGVAFAHGSRHTDVVSGPPDERTSNSLWGHCYRACRPRGRPLESHRSGRGRGKIDPKLKGG
jgi:hypothetical protein